MAGWYPAPVTYPMDHQPPTLVFSAFTPLPGGPWPPWASLLGTTWWPARRRRSAATTCTKSCWRFQRWDRFGSHDGRKAASHLANVQFMRQARGRNKPWPGPDRERDVPVCFLVDVTLLPSHYATSFLARFLLLRAVSSGVTFLLPNPPPPPAPPPPPSSFTSGSHEPLYVRVPRVPATCSWRRPLAYHH